MSAALVAVVPSWPKALGVALVIAVASLGATPAFAAPEWGITMTHANAYGLQVGECSGGKELYVPGEPEKDCGVDPFTGSGTVFDRGSGDNAYTVTVSNIAKRTGGAAAGTTLTCETGVWNHEPTFTYHWLRNGHLIAGAESSEYTLEAADGGTAVQCVVTAKDPFGAMNAAAQPIVVEPAPATSPPAVRERPKEPAEGEAAVAEGASLSCAPGIWEGSPSFTYQWLRNGVPISGATTSTYTVGAGDAGATLECQVTATNAGGSAVAFTTFPIQVDPEPEERAPHTEYSQSEPGPSIPVPVSPNTTHGTVTVAGKLPDGLALSAPRPERYSSVSGTGWSCTSPNTIEFSCSRSDALVEEHAYPQITIFVRADLGAPEAVTDSVTAAGGGASAVTASSPTAIGTVPFGIDTFTTSVTNSLSEPFTQAGGHPFAANATFVLNYVTGTGEVGHGERELITAGGATIKQAETELPSGFVGDPQNAERCTTPDILFSCSDGSIVGYVKLAEGRVGGGRVRTFGVGSVSPVWNLAPQPGSVAEFGFVIAGGIPFVLKATLRADGDYGVTIGDAYSGKNGPAPLGLSLTLCGNGVIGSIENGELINGVCAGTAQPGIAGPFLTNATRCSGPAPTTTMIANSWEHPSDYVSKSVHNGTSLVDGASNLSESFVTGCNLLQFAPEVEWKPSSEGGTTQADEPTGASFALKVPQTNKAGVNATPELKDATVTLPEGVTVDPSAADGLQACSNAQFGLGATVEPVEPATCPLASQIGTVKVITPLLEKPLEGQVFLGEPECSPCSNTDAEDGRIFRLFLQVRSVERGVIVKLAGHVTANPTTGRLQATFSDQPQLPFSELLLTFNGGARAPLANPQTCGTFTTTTDLTPWSAPGLGGLSGSEAIAGTPDATPSGSFNVDWNGAGGACPGSLPFNPSFTAGSQTPTAGASSPFSVTLGREDREQDLSGITVSTPPGLLGKIAGIPQCPQAQANAGTCGPESQIGTTTIGAGPGPHPFYLGGRVYLTGPYKGAPFGLSIVTPAVAGPFNLGTVVVRASISVNPSTAALTIASDPLPQFVDGVQLRLRKINVEVNRPGFMLNPTSCAAQAVGATITAAQGASSTLSTPFEVGACQNLPFAPKLTASSGGHASKAGGASLDVKIESAGLGQANIAKVDLQLPKALPSRLSTLQKACLAAVFNANPAACEEDSVIGKATIHTPILKAPLTGPAYLVSHGGAAFPDVEFVLQGEGVTLILDGNTDIKNGITYSRFESAPDAPFTSFETELPTGPHSILGAYVPASANYNLCGTSLAMPTIITAQNGKQIKQTTKIAVTGCKASKPSVKITKTKLMGNTLLVTVKTSADGTIRISGSDLKTTTKKNVKAGSHQLAVALSKAGKTAKAHRKKTKLRASLTVGKQAVATTISVKL